MDTVTGLWLPAGYQVTAVDSSIQLHVEWMRARGLSPATIHQRRLRLVRTDRALPCLLVGATEEHLLAWSGVRQPQLSAASWRTEVVDLRGYFRWAVLMRLRPDDPTVRLPVPRSRRRLPRTVKDARLVELLAGMSDSDRCIALLAREAGLRRAEIAGLDWSDVDVEELTVRVVGKGGHERVVPVSPVLLEALLRLPHRSGPVVRSLSSGGRCTPNQVGKRMYAVGIRPHLLRHSAVTEWAEHGGVDTARDLAGHVSLATTSIYVHVRANRGRAAVDAGSLLPSPRVESGGSVSG